jgi:hypothetical protein
MGFHAKTPRREELPISGFRFQVSAFAFPLAAAGSQA